MVGGGVCVSVCVCNYNQLPRLHSFHYVYNYTFNSLRPSQSITHSTVYVSLSPLCIQHFTSLWVHYTFNCTVATLVALKSYIFKHNTATLQHFHYCNSATQHCKVATLHTLVKFSNKNTPQYRQLKVYFDRNMSDNSRIKCCVYTE